MALLQALLSSLTPTGLLEQRQANIYLLEAESHHVDELLTSTIDLHTRCLRRDFELTTALNSHQVSPQEFSCLLISFLKAVWQRRSQVLRSERVSCLPILHNHIQMLLGLFHSLSDQEALQAESLIVQISRTEFPQKLPFLMDMMLDCLRDEILKMKGGESSGERLLRLTRDLLQMQLSKRLVFQRQCTRDIFTKTFIPSRIVVGWLLAFETSSSSMRLWDDLVFVWLQSRDVHISPATPPVEAHLLSGPQSSLWAKLGRTLEVYLEQPFFWPQLRALVKSSSPIFSLEDDSNSNELRINLTRCVIQRVFGQMQLAGPRSEISPFELMALTTFGDILSSPHYGWSSQENLSNERLVVAESRGNEFRAFWTKAFDDGNAQSHLLDFLLVLASRQQVAVPPDEDEASDVEVSKHVNLAAFSRISFLLFCISRLVGYLDGNGVEDEGVYLRVLTDAFESLRDDRWRLAAALHTTTPAAMPDPSPMSVPTPSSSIESQHLIRSAVARILDFLSHAFRSSVRSRHFETQLTLLTVLSDIAVVDSEEKLTQKLDELAPVLNDLLAAAQDAKETTARSLASLLSRHGNSKSPTLIATCALNILRMHFQIGTSVGFGNEHILSEWLALMLDALSRKEQRLLSRNETAFLYSIAEDVLARVKQFPPSHIYMILLLAGVILPARAETQVDVNLLSSLHKRAHEIFRERAGNDGVIEHREIARPGPSDETSDWLELLTAQALTILSVGDANFLQLFQVLQESLASAALPPHTLPPHLVNPLLLLSLEASLKDESAQVKGALSVFVKDVVSPLMSTACRKSFLWWILTALCQHQFLPMSFRIATATTDDSRRSQLMALAARMLAEGPPVINAAELRAFLEEYASVICAPSDPYCWRLLLRQFCLACGADFPSKGTIAGLQELSHANEPALSPEGDSTGMCCSVHFEDIDGVRKSVFVVAQRCARLVKHRLKDCQVR